MKKRTYSILSEVLQNLLVQETHYPLLQQFDFVVLICQFQNAKYPVKTIYQIISVQKFCQAVTKFLTHDYDTVCPES